MCAQYTERIFNIIAKYKKKTYLEWKSMYHRFEIYIVWNPKLKGIESISYTA